MVLMNLEGIEYQCLIIPILYEINQELISFIYG
jgi:hypothetical protein